MLSRTAAAEILPRTDQDLCLIVWRTVQDKVGVLTGTWVLSQREEERVGKTGALQRLKELFGDNHICVNVFDV